MSAQVTVNEKAVLDARDRIGSEVERTPLRAIDFARSRVWLKCENRQTGGAFKLRGASNRLLMMSPAERARGVVAFSSGNHARGVAIAARRLGILATIVMPSDAPAVKIDATREEGARIVFYDRQSESREAIAQALATESGATLVPSFDDAAVIAGQGTVGLELVAQLSESGHAAPARILVPCGGGGLGAGIALASPTSEIVVVEPEGWDDMGRSLTAGRIESVSPDAPPTLCDALQTPRVSPITFAILKERRATSAIASEAEVEAAIRFAWRELGEMVEAGGAVALAALLAGRVPSLEGTTIILSGGNIDPALHARIVA